MEKKLKHVLFFILSVIFIQGCRKIVKNSQPSSHGTILLQYIVLDTTKAAPGDTETVINLKYDINKRVTQIDNYQYTAGVPDYIQSTAYSYNNSDTLPYKSILSFNEHDSNMKEYIYYFYSSGVLIKDSTYYDMGLYQTESTNEYTYVNNKIFRTQKDTNFTDIPQLTKLFTDTFYVTKKDGDLFAQSDSTTDPDYSPMPTSNYLCQFDDHPNPFYNNLFAVHPFLTDDFLDGYQLQKNNTTQITSILSDRNQDSTVNSTVYFSYTYNADGYPVIVRARGTLAGYPNEYRKAIYIYQ